MPRSRKEQRLNRDCSRKLWLKVETKDIAYKNIYKIPEIFLNSTSETVSSTLLNMSEMLSPIPTPSWKTFQENWQRETLSWRDFWAQWWGVLYTLMLMEIRMLSEELYQVRKEHRTYKIKAHILTFILILGENCMAKTSPIPVEKDAFGCKTKSLKDRAKYHGKSPKGMGLSPNQGIANTHPAWPHNCFAPSNVPFWRSIQGLVLCLSHHCS